MLMICLLYIIVLLESERKLKCPIKKKIQTYKLYYVFQVTMSFVPITEENH